MDQSYITTILNIGKTRTIAATMIGYALFFYLPCIKQTWVLPLNRAGIVSNSAGLIYLPCKFIGDRPGYYGLTTNRTLCLIQFGGIGIRYLRMLNSWFLGFPLSMLTIGLRQNGGQVGCNVCMWLLGWSAFSTPSGAGLVCNLYAGMWSRFGLEMVLFCTM